MELSRAKNVATYVVFPLKKNDGTLLIGAAGLDSEIDAWSDGGAPNGLTDCTNEATEIGSTGIYHLSLSQTEMNNDYIVLLIKSTATGAIPQIILISTKARPIGEVTLAASQGSYAPAKAGDAMTLTAAYNAAKTATSVDDLDNLQGNIDGSIGEVNSALQYFEAEILSPMQIVVNDIHDTHLPAIKTETAVIKAKTDNIPATPANEATLTTLHGHIDDILGDTAEIQAELADGGRTDLLIDGIKTVVDANGVKLVAIQGKTDMLPAVWFSP
jgi:hypothetical protein